MGGGTYNQYGVNMKIGHKLGIAIGIVALGNMSDIFYNNHDLQFYLWYVIIFIPIIIAFNIIDIDKHKKKTAIVLFIFSCVGFWFGKDSGLVGASFLCGALYLFPKGKYLIPVSTGILLAISITGYTLRGNTPAQMAVYIGGAACIFIFYEHYIHPKPKPKPAADIKSIIPKLTNQEIEILQLLYEGQTVKEICSLCHDRDGEPVNYAPQTVRNKINTARKKLDMQTTIQLVSHLRGVGAVK